VSRTAAHLDASLILVAVVVSAVSWGCANTTYYGDPQRTFRDLPCWPAKMWLEIPGKVVPRLDSIEFVLSGGAYPKGAECDDAVALDSIWILSPQPDGDTILLWSKYFDYHKPSMSTTGVLETVYFPVDPPPWILVGARYLIRERETPTIRMVTIWYPLKFKRTFSYGGS